jgi:NADH-quinone oxidoreductase subunit A
MDAELLLLQPIFLYFVLILGFVVGTLVLAHWIAPRRPTPVKDMPYESGMDPIGDARRHFDVKFYLVAILFLLFDVELIFLYPWAVAAYAPESPLQQSPLGWSVFLVILLFLTTVAVAYLYALRKGVFRWR